MGVAAVIQVQIMRSNMEMTHPCGVGFACWCCRVNRPVVNRPRCDWGRMSSPRCVALHERNEEYGVYSLRSLMKTCWNINGW